jgi:hypothetical protein
MPVDHVEITREHIKELTFKLQELGYAERDKLREVLYRLHDTHNGKIYRLDLHKELMKLLAGHELTEIAVHNAESAIFGA